MESIENLNRTYTRLLYMFSGSCVLVSLVLLWLPSSLPSWEPVVSSFIGIWGLMGFLYTYRYRHLNGKAGNNLNLWRKMDFIRLGEWLIIVMGLSVFILGDPYELPLKWEIFGTISMLLLVTMPITAYTYLHRKRLRTIEEQVSSSGRDEKPLLIHSLDTSISPKQFRNIQVLAGLMALASGICWNFSGHEEWFLGIMGALGVGIWAWVKGMGNP